MNKKSLLRCALLLCAWSVSLSVIAQTPPFRFTEKPGPYAVGLKVVEQYDKSRAYRPLTNALGKPFVGERARPMQTLVWYPATEDASKAMTVGDYVKLVATETSFGEPDDYYVKDNYKDLGKAVDDVLWAVRDAAPSPGRFPLVVYAPSFSSSSWENADLCELLASHGYVVIASPDMGAKSRGMTDDVGGINAQANDIEFLIGYAAGLPNTDISEIAVAGWSWGGISNLFAAARDNRIKALVDLDGSVRYFPGLVEKAGDVHPDQMTVPLLFFAQGETTREELSKQIANPANTGPSALNAWTHGDLLTVEMLGFIHAEFSSMYQRQPVWSNFERWQKADYGREDGMTGYGWVARYTLKFLDAYLKHDAAAVTFLKNKPASNGVPPHLMKVNFCPGKGVAPSLDGFRGELGRQGFDHAADVYAAMKTDQADFKLAEDSLIAWGYDLLLHDHVTESIAIFKLTVQEYSTSTNAFESLGEAYARSGQKSLAKKAFEKALHIDPHNDSASKELSKLR